MLRVRAPEMVTALALRNRSRVGRNPIETDPLWLRGLNLFGALRESASLCSPEKIIHAFGDLNRDAFSILGHFVHEEIRTIGIMFFIKRMARFVRQHLCDLEWVGGHRLQRLRIEHAQPVLTKAVGLSWLQHHSDSVLRGAANLPYEKDPELSGPIDSSSILDNEIAVLAASAHIDVRTLDAIAVDVLGRRDPKVDIGLGKVNPLHMPEPIRLFGGAIDSLGPYSGGCNRALAVGFHVMERD